jgi:hypothetical protein
MTEGDPGLITARRNLAAQYRKGSLKTRVRHCGVGCWMAKPTLAIVWVWYGDDPCTVWEISLATLPPLRGDRKKSSLCPFSAWFFSAWQLLKKQ